MPSLILVVDEDPQIHQVVDRWLEDAGYECVNALTPRDARDILRAGAAPTVVILADHFREESGLNFAQRLIQRGRDLGFLFLATFDSAYDHGGQPLGLPERILMKPLSRRNLIVAVDELVLAVEATTRGIPKSLLSHSVGRELIAMRRSFMATERRARTGAVYPL